MQALQLELRARLGRHLQNGGDGGRVVGGKLRVNRIRRLQQGAGTGQVGHVGVVLVGENRVVRQSQLLRALDLGVPVGAFDQAAHQANLVLSRNLGDVLYQLQRPALVGLQRQAETAPMRRGFRNLRHQHFEHLQRQLQPVHLFGIDSEVDVGRCRLRTQAPHARHQLGHDAGLLRILIPWVQGAELDRDAVVFFAGAVWLCGASDRANCILVTRQVLQGVGIGACALAQHVVAVTQVLDLALCRCRLGHGLGYGLPEHKLPTQQLHGAQCRRHHRTRTELGKHAARCFTLGQELLAHRNRCARQARQRLVTGRIEVGPPQLIGCQGDGGFGVRHAQQGLGQPHQSQAFGAGNRVLLEQALHGPERRRVVSHRLHPWRGSARRGSPIESTGQHTQTLRDNFSFRTVGKG